MLRVLSELDRKHPQCIKCLGAKVLINPELRKDIDALVEGGHLTKKFAICVECKTKRQVYSRSESPSA
jgi:hypothetical protein